MDLGGCVFHAGIGSTHHFPGEEKDQKCPASFLPFPLPVSQTAISKKSANRGEENSAITLTTTVLYISLFPDFMGQSITIAQRIKSSSVYHTSIIRVSLQPVDRDYI